MVTSELTGEVSMGVLLVFLVSWRRGRYIGSDQQGDSITWYVYSMYLGNKGDFFFSTWKYFALFLLVLLCCCARYVVIFILSYLL